MIYNLYSSISPQIVFTQTGVLESVFFHVIPGIQINHEYSPSPVCATGRAVYGDYTDHMFPKVGKAGTIEIHFSIPIESKPFHIYLHLPYKLPMHVGK